MRRDLPDGGLPAFPAGLVHRNEEEPLGRLHLQAGARLAFDPVEGLEAGHLRLQQVRLPLHVVLRLLQLLHLIADCRRPAHLEQEQEGDAHHSEEAGDDQSPALAQRVGDLPV